MSEFEPEPYDDLEDDDGRCPICGAASDEECDEINFDHDDEDFD